LFLCELFRARLRVSLYVLSVIIFVVVSVLEVSFALPSKVEKVNFEDSFSLLRWLKIFSSKLTFLPMRIFAVFDELFFEHFSDFMF
jgi:hypothetical protein